MNLAVLNGSSSQPPSLAQVSEVLCSRAKVSALRDQQIKPIMSLVTGNDTFVVLPTGGGKTLVMQAPLIVADAMGRSGKAFIIVPTKILADQQAEQARNYGLYALSITEDTVRIAVASRPSRDLFKDFADRSGVAVAVMSPQMMGGDRINKLMQSQAFRTLVRWVLVDESHLVDEQGSTFIAPYKTLASWRARLGSKTVWGAFTGTASRSRAPHITQALGFVAGEYVYTRYPIDRPNIKYLPRFFEHSFSGESLLDFTFLIPFNMTSPQAIQKTLVFAKTIEYGDRVIRFLDYIIALRFPHLTERSKIIMPYNSLMPQDYRNQFAEDFRDEGSVLRIGVVTDTCTYGLDLPNVRRVVIADMDRTPENLKQSMGRAGRDGDGAIAIAFAPPWVRRPPDGAVVKGKQALKDAKRREALPPFTQQFYNPSSTLCPRRADLEHYGDEYHPELPCACVQHTPDPEQTDDSACVQLWVQYLSTESVTPRALSLRSDGTYPPLATTMKSSLTAMLNIWTIRQWVPFRRQHGISELMPVACFCPRHILERLVEKAHVCTTVERLGVVMDGWEHLATHGEPLLLWLTVILKEWKEIYGERRESQAVGVDPIDEVGDDSDRDEAMNDGDAEEVTAITVRAARGDFHRSSRDFHLSPPKTVNYGEGENKVIVNFDESPCQRGKLARVTSPINLFSYDFVAYCSLLGPHGNSELQDYTL